MAGQHVIPLNVYSLVNFNWDRFGSSDNKFEFNIAGHLEVPDPFQQLLTDDVYDLDLVVSDCEDNMLRRERGICFQPVMSAGLLNCMGSPSPTLDTVIIVSIKDQIYIALGKLTQDVAHKAVCIVLHSSL